MRFLRTVLIAAFATAPLAAQVVHTNPPAGGAGREARIAPPPRERDEPRNFHRRDLFNPGFPPGMAFFPNIPIIALPDGRVFADFGRGFERIVRNCNVVLYFGEPPVIQPTVIQPTVTQPPVVVPGFPVVYSPPIQDQVTPPQQIINLADQLALANRSTLVNESSCWAGDWRRLVYIARP